MFQLKKMKYEQSALKGLQTNTVIKKSNFSQPKLKQNGKSKVLKKYFKK